MTFRQSRQDITRQDKNITRQELGEKTLQNKTRHA